MDGRLNIMNGIEIKYQEGKIMSIIIDVNKCYYKYLIRGKEEFDFFNSEEQETIMNALGFIIEEDITKKKYLLDTDRGEYRSRCDSAWDSDIADAVEYDSIDEAFGDICEPYVVDYFSNILEKDLGEEVPEGTFEDYDILRYLLILIEDEKNTDTDGEKVPNMYLRAYQELFYTVCLFHDNEKKLYEKILTEIAEKLSTIKSVITISKLIDKLDDLKFILCRRDDSILSKRIEREYMLHGGLESGKCTMIGSFSGRGKSRHPVVNYSDIPWSSIAHIQPKMPLEITRKFFNKAVADMVKIQGESAIKENQEKLQESIIKDRNKDIIENTYYGININNNSHLQKVEESNNHFKSFVEKNKRK